VASQEYLAWGEITQKSIHATLKFHSIENLARNSVAVNKFLRLDVLRLYGSVLRVRTHFLANPVVLDEQIGIAIAEVLLKLGFTVASGPAMITEGIYHLLQGWAVTIPLEDPNCLPRAFRGFRAYFLSFSDSPMSLSTLSQPTLVENISIAFEKGVEKAATALLNDLPRSRPVKRSREKNKAIVARYQI
jgi:hypothetical protein